MRPWLLACILSLCSVDLEAQVTHLPGSSQGQTNRQGGANYGPPRVVELDTLYLMPEAYQRNHVIVTGDLEQIGSQYWGLRSGGSRVLLIAHLEVDSGLFMQSLGRRVQIRGIVRMIRNKERVGNPPVDRDLIDDPNLPVLPPPSSELPRVSITALAIRDPEGGENGKATEASAGMERLPGKTTRILGQFRGRNLFGDLPAGSARGKDDWVLKDGETAMWVMGKAPKGDGWKLDLDYKGDSKTWLEVEGKLETVNGITYLKASRVVPRKAPDKDIAPLR
jgi:hypothetical protein